MKQYLLAVHSDEAVAAASPEVMERMFAQVDVVNKEMMEAGAWVFAGGLMPAETATVVRMEHGKAVLTDGPFAEAKEHMGGFWVLKCADLDEALRWAEKATVACEAPVELRPFQDEPEA